MEVGKPDPRDKTKTHTQIQINEHVPLRCSYHAVYTPDLPARESYRPGDLGSFILTFEGPIVAGIGMMIPLGGEETF